MATANMKDVKRRIKSVESTRQITKAMELVASSKLRRAKERALAAQPFFAAVYDTMADVSRDHVFSSIYTKKEVLKTILMVVIAGDRGLAGGFNNNVLKLALEKANEHKNEGFTVKVITIGKKAVEYFRKRDFEVLDEYPGIAESLNVYDSLDIAENIILRFRMGEFDRVELVYTTFVSALTQEPVFMPILPVKQMISGSGEKKSLMIYDPSPEEVFDGLIPQYISGMIYAATVDSFASEQAARRTAMESASDNADEMIANLSLMYNRARQGQITQELTEIASGSLREE
ncbi:ATP synthase F1 subunit gamma [Ruminococcus sp. NK3A76]|uniref:ATP synthase F1 subunit gamma n=1 Tax=Ruminococcus sp. NK3A76 TaxID=877411 RepID=UPI00049021D0|nr:ATP synthase F1 subunit gamma [Ruminococcus sp. NK3A76]